MSFETELGWIVTPEIRRIAEQGVALIPEYFYHVPASSSGKYHPAYAVIPDGGLYQHVKAAVAIAQMLYRCESVFHFTQIEKDLCLASLILHDGWKQGVDGSGGHTLHEHPVLAQEILLECIIPEDEVSREYLYLIGENISSHMGQWNTNARSKVVLPVPTTKMQKFVHLCDYLASRKPLEFNFAVPVV